MSSISLVILLLLASPLQVFGIPLKHVIVAWGKRTTDTLVKDFSIVRIVEEFAQCSALLSPPTLCPCHALGMDQSSHVTCVALLTVPLPTPHASFVLGIVLGIISSVTCCEFKRLSFQVS